LLEKRDALQARLTALSKEPKPSKQINDEISNLNKQLKDLNLQLLGGEETSIPSTVTTEQLARTKEHIVSKTDTLEKEKTWDKLYRNVIDKNRSLSILKII
jgi:hypothetical protein